MNRLLLITRRTIPLDRLDDYLAEWQRVRAAAEAAGGRAWLFRGTGRQDHFIEFLEWDEASVPPLPDHEDVANARLELDQTFGTGVADKWEETS